jgi:serine protease AprX
MHLKKREKTSDMNNKRAFAMSSRMILALAAAAWLPLSAASKKHSADLDTVTGNVTVVISYNQSPPDAHLQKLVAAQGSVQWKSTYVNAVAATIPVSALAALESDAAVSYIASDRAVNPTLDYTTAAVNANVAFSSGLTGAGVAVAIVDSGVNPHLDLSDSSGKSRIVYSQSFVVGDTSVFDEYGHGTHVAGIVAGDGASSTGPQFTHTFRGLAPAVQIVNLKALNRQGVGTDSAVIAAIDRAIQLKNTYNIRVLNLSLGRPVFESYVLDPLCQAVEAAWKAGIVVVVAAGNDGRNNTFGNNGYATINSPGNDPYAITVGAMKTEGTYANGDDLIASYSSKGPTLFDHVVKPDLVAPGNRVISDMTIASYLSTTYPANQVKESYFDTTPLSKFALSLGLTSSFAYFQMSGTSMATPVVSGAAALMIGKNSALTPDQVKARLMKTANKQFPVSSVAVDPLTNISYASQYDIFTIGAGYLDVWAALNNNDTAKKGLALSPSVSYNQKTGVTSLNLSGPAGTTIVWGTNIVWGTTIVWGTNVFLDGGSAIWGTTIVWGTNTSQAFNAIWGNTIVWGTGTGLSNSEAIAVNGEN